MKTKDKMPFKDGMTLFRYRDGQVERREDCARDEEGVIRDKHGEVVYQTQDYYADVRELLLDAKERYMLQQAEANANLEKIEWLLGPQMDYQVVLKMTGPGGTLWSPRTVKGVSVKDVLLAIADRLPENPSLGVFCEGVRVERETKTT